MSDPVEWLTEKLVEIEGTAEGAKACGDTWTHNHHGGDYWLITGSESGSAYDTPVVVYDEGAPNEDQAAHIAACDPAMVLRLVAATRAVLELHYPNFRYVPMTKDRWIYLSGAEAVAMAARTDEVWKGDLECDVCGDENGGGENPRLPWPCPTLRAVAAGWGWVDE